MLEFVSSIKNLLENIKSIIGDPITLLAIIGCVLIFIVLIKAKNVIVTKQMITRIGIALALSIILSFIKIYQFPQGGSITLGRFVPILFIAFMYGPIIGLFTGLIDGILDFILNPYIFSPLQVLFDYPLAFMMIGLSGFFPNNKGLGVIVGTLGRMICSVISGAVFFGDYAPSGMNPLVYSLYVNVPVIGIEGIICLVVIMALPINQLISYFNKSRV